MRSFLLILMVIIAPGEILAQPDVPPAVFPDLPQFYVDAVSFWSDSGRTRLDIYVEVPYEALRFIKDGDVFRSNYEVSVDIYDSTDKMIDDKWWTEKIETRNYEESISPTLGNLSQRSFGLVPGNYAVSVQIKDRETDKTSRIKRRVSVRDMVSGEFVLSDIMLVNKVDTVGTKKMVYPNISGNVGELKEGFTIFFEAYNRIGADTALVTSAVRNVRGDVVASDTFACPLAKGRTSCFHRELTSKLIAGDYILDLSAAPSGKTPSPVSASSTRLFVIRWRGLPVTITDLDLAIDQLQYITDKDKIDEMKAASPEKKRDMFAGFWKKRDPTPSSERNELMEEYYARVAYADKHFSHYVDGWKTDMGMVYIIFGAPSNIERHPFDIDSKPYEVWTYYELNRQFVFIDATGFGDFRLQSPIWDLTRTRPH